VRALRLFIAAGLLVLGTVVGEVLPASAHGDVVAITIEHYSFSPASLTIDVGGTVTWTNNDQAPHDITTTSSPEALKSPTLSKGMSWSHTFTTPGTYVYICSIHPDMRATLVVKAAPAPIASVPATAAPAATAPAATAPHHDGQPNVRPASAPTSAGGTGMIATPNAAAPRGQARTAITSSAAAAVPRAVSSPQLASATGPVATVRPLLVVAGIVTAGAVLCLLMLASRPNEG
jgi:plastocyanin